MGLIPLALGLSVPLVLASTIILVAFADVTLQFRYAVFAGPQFVLQGIPCCYLARWAPLSFFGRSSRISPRSGSSCSS